MLGLLPVPKFSDVNLSTGRWKRMPKYEARYNQAESIRGPAGISGFVKINRRT